MQNILFFVFRLYGGGAERVVSNLSLALGEHFNVKIAVYDDQEKAYAYKGELIRIRLPFSTDPTSNAWWKRPFRLLVLVLKLRKIKREHEIDVTISFGEQPNIINLLTRNGRRTILSVRSILSQEIAHYPKLKVLGHFVRLLYNKASLIIVPSRMAASDLSTYFGVDPQKLKVIHNFIDQDHISTMDSEPLAKTFHEDLFKYPVLLNVGRITAAKGQWLLIRAMQKLKLIHSSFKLVIIGESETEGNLKSELIELANEQGLKIYDSLSNQNPSLDFDIYFLGFIPNPFRYMKRSEMLLFPSLFEGFPNSILEAMQTGLPVIAADSNSGTREILDPDSVISKHSITMEITEYGILCPPLVNSNPKDPIPDEILEPWVQAIDLLAKKNGLRNDIIQNGYRRVRDFDKTKILQEWRLCISPPL